MVVRLNPDSQEVMLGPNTAEPRILHTMILTRDLEESIRFYCEGLGMRALTDLIEADRSRLSVRFVGYEGANAGGGMIELVHHWDNEEECQHERGATHVAIGVPDADNVLARLEEWGAGIDRRGKAAFVTDPNGYELEIVQTFRLPGGTDVIAGSVTMGPRTIIGPNDGKRRILHTMVRTCDLDASVRFYVDVLGMMVLTERIQSPTFKLTALFVGYKSAEEGGVMIELVEPWDNTEAQPHEKGVTHLAIGVADGEAMVARLMDAGAEVELRAGVPFARDPDGYQIEIIQSLR